MDPDLGLLGADLTLLDLELDLAGLDAGLGDVDLGLDDPKGALLNVEINWADLDLWLAQGDHVV